jgi:glucose-6-phosphate 1-epimerase
MIRALAAVAVLSSAAAFTAKPFSLLKRSSMTMLDIPQGRAPPGMKPRPDGTFGVAGEHLPQYILEMDNGSKAFVRTFGCNLFTWITKDGIEIIGKRKDAVAIDSDSKPYAGGVPHCFPQFGPGEILQHGFARGMKFIPEERAKKLSFDRMIFKLEPTAETEAIWNYDFEYRVDVTLREASLEWDVIIMNKGDKPYTITTGLHSYLDVSSLGNVQISGPFSGAKTVDKNTGAEGVASSNDISITAPIDTLYKGVTGPIVITDSVKGTKLTLTSKGYTDTVVWNPFGNEDMGYDKFVCVEPVVSEPLTIPVGKFKETKLYHKIAYEKL